jgi:phage-related protein
MHQARFYRTAADREVVRDWIRDFSKEDQRILGRDLLKVQQGFPLGLPLCRSLGNGLWEIRSTLTGRIEGRMIFYFDSPLQSVVVLHGFIKKSQKTPKSEIDVALYRKRESES